MGRTKPEPTTASASVSTVATAAPSGSAEQHALMTSRREKVDATAVSPWGPTIDRIQSAVGI